MKISLKQLKQIIKEEISRSRKVLKESTGEAGAELVDEQNCWHLEVGNEYKIDGSISTFVGWFDDTGSELPDDVNDDPTHVLLKFQDVDGFEWEAYWNEGNFCVGSSADPLRVAEAESESHVYDEENL